MTLQTLFLYHYKVSNTLDYTKVQGMKPENRAMNNP